MYFYRRGSFSLFCCLSSLVFAQPTESFPALTKPIEAKIWVNQTEIIVQLQHYALSPKARRSLATRAGMRFFSEKKTLLGEKQLGMNDVPVLNQGAFGSCVTFANIGAIDALLSPKDYISEWCNLTLGQYLEKNSKNYQSGWNGSYGEIVLNQMLYLGVIPKQEEGTIRCGDVDSYAAAGSTSAAMSLSDFNRYSHELTHVAWNPILTYMDGLYFKNKEMMKILDEVRSTLIAGDRMTLGFLIDDTQLFLGIEGQRYVPNDTWVMTPEIEAHLSEGKVDAGHEVIVTGFDDNAVVYDKKGQPHQGVLTLRNSWGAKAGNQGDYYMTYDYFLQTTVEVQRIFRIKTS